MSREGEFTELAFLHLRPSKVCLGRGDSHMKCPLSRLGVQITDFGFTEGVQNKTSILLADKVSIRVTREEIKHRYRYAVCGLSRLERTFPMSFQLSLNFKIMAVFTCLLFQSGIFRGQIKLELHHICLL